MKDDSAAATLRARARALARPPVEAPTDGTTMRLLEFRLAQEHYAVETRHVREVILLSNLTQVPCTPPFVVGIVNVRGHILPVLDLMALLGLPTPLLIDLHYVVVVGGPDIEFGLLVDVIVGVRSVPSETVQSPPPALTGTHGNYLTGVAGERLAVLDVARILADPRIIVDEEVET